MPEPETDQARKKKVIVGMSGGVDSSVAALLCLQSGHEVEGLFMKNWDEDDGSEYCTAKQDLEDADQVCRKLGIKLNHANFAAEYWDNVFQEFLREYKSGRTPNPDVLCNREIKFNVFARYSRMLGAESISTGHYARLQKTNNGIRLLKARDHQKDQSYFLQAVSQEQLKNVIFQLGKLKKTEVREIAKKNNLATHSKKDSTGICFIGERRFRDFLNAYLKAKPGKIVDEKGTVLGEHQGLMFHTLGQRQGLNIGGKKGAQEKPWYVSEKSLEENKLVVVQGNKHPSLFSHSIYLDSISWIGPKPDLPENLAVKLRYRQADQSCILTEKGKGFLVRFRIELWRHSARNDISHLLLHVSRFLEN